MNKKVIKHIVSFSGGRTSAYLVHLMEKKRIKDGLDVEYVFMDTGAEHKSKFEKITGWTGRSNEDTRSAAFFGFLAASKSNR